MPRMTVVPSERAADAVPAADPLCVLVADFDPDTRALYQTTLRLAGCDVIEASDGRDALTKALVRVPSLVITELRLPFVDGFALCDILRRDRSTSCVPILIVTTDTRPAEINRARTLADGVLTKPTLPETLVNEIRRLLTPTPKRDHPPVALRADAADESMASGVHCTNHRRTVLVKAHSRFTTATPPVAPPALTCPSCDRPLVYERSHIGGVSDRNSEQWDYFTCSTCGGGFQYRQRTRKLRALSTSEEHWMKASQKV